jgi:uncharacterized protein
MKNVLVSQNPHWNNVLTEYVIREKMKQLIDYLPLRQIITISGIRRCGKSSLVKQTITHLIKSGVDPLNILFVNLEQPFFLEYKHDANYLNTIYEEYLKIADPQGRVYVLFDEIQFFENWQVFIKSRYENSDIKFIITGSNSSLLSEDLNTLLSGRALNIHLDTFSFKEFLNYKGIKHRSEIEKATNKIDIARALDEYLKWGGFYEVFDVESEFIKEELLISYAKNIIYQDIVPRYKIRNSEILERLFFYFLSNSTRLINYTTLSKVFEISDKTIKEYISHFEEVFLLKRIDKYHTKLKERNRSFKKIYVRDNGFLQIAPKHSKDLGQSLENIVYNTLLAKNRDVYYLRNKYEVDFYSEQILYQVAYDISSDKTKKRELNAFNHFENIKDNTRKLITYETNELIGDVEVISIDQFLLD